MAVDYKNIAARVMKGMSEIIQENERLKKENEELREELFAVYGYGYGYGYQYCECEDYDVTDPYYCDEYFSPYGYNKHITGNYIHTTNNKNVRHYQEDAMGIKPYKLISALNKMIQLMTQDNLC